MSFNLEFTPEFFIGPYDLEGGKYDEKHPVSVWQAVSSMSDRAWWRMAKEVFDDRPPELITVDMVIKQIRQMDTCRDLRSPVEIYIDEGGYHTIRVYNSADA